MQTIADPIGGPTWLGFLGGGLAIRLGFDLLATFLLVRFIYYRRYRRSDLALTFFSFNLVIFLIAYLMNRFEMSLGAAFGLFAVFSMLRYRTEGISAKDMTYLFLVIALGLITAIGTTWGTLLLTVCAVLVLTHALESGWIMKREESRDILYENLALVHAESRAELMADLTRRTGLRLHRVEIREIDYARDVARLTLYCSEETS